MANTLNRSRQVKISREFSARLEELGPRQKVRAILMLDPGSSKPPLKMTRLRSSRQAAIAATREAAESSLPDIDQILQRFSGRRLAPHVDALGCIPVETTAAGIAALASSKHVKAILEDQPVSLLAPAL